MKLLRWFEITICLLSLGSALAVGDSIQLRNGRHLQGKYIGGTTTMVGFMTSGAVEYFATADVLALMFDNNTDSPLNGVLPNHFQPNHRNGDSSSEALPARPRETSTRPRTRKLQSKAKAEPANAVPASVAD